MKTNLVRIVLAVVIVSVGIQFIPVNRSNPPVEEEIPVSPEVKAILKRACYDCHSNETIWPGYIAGWLRFPGSWPGIWEKGLTQQRDEKSHRNFRNKLILKLFLLFLNSRFLPFFGDRKTGASN